MPGLAQKTPKEVTLLCGLGQGVCEKSSLNPKVQVQISGEGSLRVRWVARLVLQCPQQQVTSLSHNY